MDSLRARQVVLISLVAFVVLTTAGWLATGHEADQLASWIEAVAAFGVLLAALVAALFAHHAYQLAVARERGRREDG